MKLLSCLVLCCELKLCVCVWGVAGGVWVCVCFCMRVVELSGVAGSGVYPKS